MLGACRVCGAPAVEQVRGEMTKSDPGFVNADAYNAPGAPRPDPKTWSSNSPANAGDTRVTCTKCDNATGWNKQDFADYSRFVWNRDCAKVAHA